MEMSLVLPNNYVELEQEEMMYVDGGDWNNLRRNLIGIGLGVKALQNALRFSGLWGKLFKAGKFSYKVIAMQYGGIIASHAWVFGAAGIFVAVGAFVALWNFKLFY